MLHAMIHETRIFNYDHLVAPSDCLVIAYIVYSVKHTPVIVSNNSTIKLLAQIVIGDHLGAEQSTVKRSK